MELKLYSYIRINRGMRRLNRTFYGIETWCRARWRFCDGMCLNRTFYGIETGVNVLKGVRSRSLNRTFYGIETFDGDEDRQDQQVLIVPFMELKRRFDSAALTHFFVLIVPFMELKPSSAVISLCFYVS